MITQDRLNQAFNTENDALDFGMDLVAFGGRHVKLDASDNQWVISWDAKRSEDK